MKAVFAVLCIVLCIIAVSAAVLVVLCCYFVAAEISRIEEEELMEMDYGSEQL